MSIVRRSLFVLWFVSLLPAQEDASRAIAELLRLKDDADVKLVETIVAARSREAAEGLGKAYDAVASPLWRREIAKGLVQLANVPAAEQLVLDKLANVAGSSDTEDEVRNMALAALGESPKLGRALLKKIVDSEVPDPLREAALRQHVKGAVADDAAWYRHLWNYKQEQRKDSKGNISPPEFNPVRELAVQGLLPFVGEQEIIDGMKRETDPKIRRAMLAFMQKQQMPHTAEQAADMLERVDYPGVERAEAARIYAERVGTKAVEKFVALAKPRDTTPEDLREKMAELIADMKDDATDKRMVKLIGKGKPHEKVFALLATARVMDPKVVAAIRKGLTDDAPEVRRATAQVLGSRRDKESVPDLRNLLTKSKYPGDARIAIEAITAIEGMGSAWLKELATYATNADREMRNAAIEVLGQARDKQYTPVLAQALAHEDWSTRFAAIEALETMRDKEAVAKLIARLDQDQGRLRKRVAEALWNLTAQPFEEDAAKWRTWWQEAAEKFTVATEQELDKARAERDRKRLSARTATKAKFFGIQVESHRVIFILDISGSMLESMYGRYVGKHGASRIDIAKQETTQAIQNLEPGTLFNVFSFSSSVARWQKEGIGVNTAQSRQDALTWVERLGAAGATNLYDAVKQAFDDRDVDTIFIMSDGEPTNGEIVDPFRIREEIAFWNKHRKVKINCIAIGGNLEVLEWLAKDSGGSYVQMR